MLQLSLLTQALRLLDEYTLTESPLTGMIIFAINNTTFYMCILYLNEVALCTQLSRPAGNNIALNPA